ncbi:MAG TPA: diaminopimelate decarboxylase [Candidatus Deferrimicrobiaceae bacterium]|nr:diaminopimelate decarboxylase [Candidatus Deferrimicrobiaceae bacterium]
MNRPSEPSQMVRPPGFVLRPDRKGLFHRKEKSNLYCEDVALTKIAERYGTPLYVYSATAILERLSDFQKAFRSVPHTICYSVKANSNLNILRLLAREGCGFDVVSGGELERVLVADRRAARKVVFSGVGKSRDEMTAALKAGILLFNVESESELWVLAECAARARRVARIALRVNPDVAAHTHPYISTGLRKHKFGVPIRNARELYAKASASRYLKVAGVSVHIGSQITDIAPFAEAVVRVVALVRDLRADGHRIDYVDTGGGLGIDYQKLASDFADYAARYARAVTNPLRGVKVHLLLEPGRAIVGPAGVLLTSVIYRKENGGKHFLVVDAAMNDLIRPALYGAYHEIVPAVQPKETLSKIEVADVVGPVCESGDFFARDRELPRVEEGDLLAILDVGAYGMALASNYNSRPRPAEILVRGKSAKVIRRRETSRELYSAEL